MAGPLEPLLAYAAGALTILSPCVLPLVPITFASAAQNHRWGPFALAAGLVASFTATGFIVAVFGEALGLDGDPFRLVGGALLLLMGAVLLIPQAQPLMERIAAPMATWAAGRQSGLHRFGLLGQAGIGVLLGLVWSPCVGPTLGAATVLASQGQNLGQVALVMAAFGLGIATVLLALGLAAGQLLTLWRGRMMSVGRGGKKLLGAALALVGVLILTGADHILEGAVLAASPEWLTTLTTSI